MVDQEEFEEDMRVDANQENIANSDNMSQSNAENKDSSTIQEPVEPLHVTDASGQPTGAPTWAEAEIEIEDDESGRKENADVGNPLNEDSPPVPSDVSSQAAFNALAEEISALKSQLEERTAQYVRIVADFENFRKRTQKERDEVEQGVKCKTIVELLPVVDNFERARSQLKPQTDGEMALHKSYQSVYKQLVDCLKRIGVAPMRSEGNPFDPTLHEAVMREPTPDHPEGTVIEELVRGYMLGERVLRHAMVKVAAEPEPVIPSDEVSQENEES